MTFSSRPRRFQRQKNLPGTLNIVQLSLPNFNILASLAAQLNRVCRMRAKAATSDPAATSVSRRKATRTFQSRREKTPTLQYTNTRTQNVKHSRLFLCLLLLFFVVVVFTISVAIDRLSSLCNNIRSNTVTARSHCSVRVSALLPPPPPRKLNVSSST